MTAMRGDRPDGLPGREPDEFEEELLTRALRRVNAPGGFASRVADLATKRKEQTKLWRFRLPPGLASAGRPVAAMLLLGIAGGIVGDQVYMARLRHQREQAALAERQFAAAMRVTEHALAETNAQLKRAGLDLAGLGN